MQKQDTIPLEQFHALLKKIESKTFDHLIALIENDMPPSQRRITARLTVLY